ncbi:MAG TPA: LLM class flavin-dependent oxidoreductase [Ktedonobacterales bacterium]|jgi:alkanesulfonate monooxygenase SsuD/methylene tetrahydromethanopterin reductase-like flavin-dependent oxidoreductase (luciferase family)
MRVGIGLPTVVPGMPGPLVVEWARRAEEQHFSSLGVLDRLAYQSYEPLLSLAAAASATNHLQLVTMVVIGPLRHTAMLAKMAASLDALSGGRLVLGLAVGARREDYLAAGVDYHTRGKRLAEQLATLRALWEEGGLSAHDSRESGPDLLVGGLSDQGFGRLARYADGYVHGGGPPRTFARAADKARAAWSDAGRPGKPQLWAQAYFALGEEAAEAGRRYLKDYYAFTGPFVERIAEGLLTTPQAIAQFLRGYEEAGCDEMVLLPTVPSLSQLDRLAEVLRGLGRLR